MVRELLAITLLAGVAWSEEQDTRVDELTRRNAELEKRVQQLEQTALEESVNQYLETALPEASLHPGSVSLTLSGQIRIRGEIQHHLYSPMDPAGALSFQFVHQRVRVKLTADVLENLGIVVEIQDVRVWGEEGSTTGNITGVDLKQGFIVFRQLGGRPFDFEAGRLYMKYDDERIIGALEWFDQGRAYDGVRGRYAPESFYLDFFAVIVRETQPLTDDDQWFAGVFGGTREWLDGLDIDGYAIWFADQLGMMGEVTVGDTGFVALGFRVHGESDGWDYSAHATFQAGEVKDDDLAAFGFAGIIGFTIHSAAWKPRFGLEFDLATGDNDPTDGDQGALQTLFPTNHLYYGYADLVGWSNMMDIRVTVSVHPSSKWKVQLDVHHFRVLDEQGAWVNAGGAVIRTGAPGVSTHLGDEVDITIVWRLYEPVTFLLGYSIFVPGGFIEDTGASPTAHFAYLQTRVTF